MQKENSLIKQQANEWLIKLETGGMLDGDEERFIQWLEQSEDHATLFYEAEQAWKIMHDAAKLEVSKPVNVKKLDYLNAYRWLTATAASLLLFIGSMFWGQDIYYSLASDHYTSTGQRNIYRLPDNSYITLNTNSAVSIDFTETSRNIRLLTGEVFVDVAHDPNRPLNVQVNEIQVTALGTSFLVRADQGKPSITVTEHSVKVTSLTNIKQSVVVEEGFQVIASEETVNASDLKAVNTQKVQAWLNGRYIFNNEPIENVINELSRYHKGKIILRDKKLGKIQISGLLNIDDSTNALSSLEKIAPVKVVKVTDFVIFIEKA